MAATCTSMSEDGDFSSSKLGTKEYWDEAYEKEKETFEEDGDPGEVWFGYDSVERIVNWLEESSDLPKSSSVLDLGCGNGVMLVELSKEGWTDLTGVDYSAKAVDLAKSVAESEQMEIHYETGDLISALPTCDSCLAKKYKILIDKGTYDAISLNPESPVENRSAYIANVAQLLKEHGLLIMTSCNWTEDELKVHFLKDYFTFHQKIPSRSFSFGGHTGNTETCLVFKKKQ